MLFRQTLLYLPAQFLGPLFQFLAAVVWTHQMDAAAYGVVTYLIAAQELSFLFALGWWSAYVLRFSAELAERYGDNLRRQDLAFVVAGSAFQILAAFPMLWSINVAITPSLAALTTVFLLTRSALAHYAEICRAEKAIGTYTVGQLASPVIGTSLSFAALYVYGSDPRAVLGALSLAQAGALIVVLRQLRVNGSPILPDRALLRDALAYCGPLIAAGIPAWISSNGIRLVVDEFSGPVVLGLLSAGWGLGQRISAVAATLVTAAAYPLAVQRLKEGDEAEALRQVAANGMLILGVLAPVAVGAAIVARPLAELVIAEPYRAATILVFPLATVAGSIRNYYVHGINQAFLLILRTDLVLLVNSIDAALNLAFCALGLWVGGLDGAVIGCIAASLLSLGVSAGFAVRMGLPILLATIARILASAAIMGAVLAVVAWPRGIVGLAATIAAGGLLYATLLLIVFPEVRDGVLRAARRLRPR